MFREDIQLMDKTQDHVPYAIAVIDRGCNIEWVNTSFESITGVPAKDILVWRPLCFLSIGF